MTSNDVSCLAGRRLACVITCEHARNRLPDPLELGIELGLPAHVLPSHAAFDPGAEMLAVACAGGLAAPLFLGRYSRLFVDLNRSPENCAVIPTRAFGMDVPGNVSLTSEARSARIARHHAPYWRAVERALRAELAAARAVLHLSVHSFTPVLGSEVRTLDVGLLYDPARPLESVIAARLAHELEGHAIDVRHNAPYDGRSDSLQASLRARMPHERYAGLAFELNHRHLGAIDFFADRLVMGLEAVLTELDIS